MTSKLSRISILVFVTIHLARNWSTKGTQFASQHRSYRVTRKMDKQQRKLLYFDKVCHYYYGSQAESYYYFNDELLCSYNWVNREWTYYNKDGVPLQYDMCPNPKDLISIGSVSCQFTRTLPVKNKTRTKGS